ncbi:C-type lectin domain family 6 member A-like isoform X2 [Hippoglossus hippoglossus]|uniref:C-type lectin domain family 6 member A-like isoform X2 n=1 Tax=Hippoglossus hippoglossus TaxID=8267 RepID=UPI00148CC38B|nr:C-type lectin domain family 6 member A-like isoform X2 [Hippoglossus hippoglossus]
MAEAEVLYSDIKFTRARGNTDVATPSTDEPTYSEVKISKTQRPAELPGSKQPAASNRRSGVTSERVALLVLSVLLAAAVTALGVTLYKNTQTMKSLQKLQDKAKNLTDDSDERLMKVTFCLTEILSKTEPCKVEQPCKPPSVRNEACPRCEDGWEPHGGKLYFFSLFTLTWNQSRRQCRSMRGDLVVINNREEQRFLVSRLSEKMDNPEDKFWIGLTDSKNEGEWLWVDNTQLDPSLTFWRHREPDNWTGENPDGEDCVRMGEEDLESWSDGSCKSHHKSFCEKPEKACP